MVRGNEAFRSEQWPMWLAKTLQRKLSEMRRLYKGLQGRRRRHRAFYDKIVPQLAQAFAEEEVGVGKVNVTIGPGGKWFDKKRTGQKTTSSIGRPPWNRGQRRSQEDEAARQGRSISTQPTQSRLHHHPAMREKASAGLPLFRKGADQTTGLAPTQFTQALSGAFGAKVADRLQAKGRSPAGRPEQACRPTSCRTCAPATSCSGSTIPGQTAPMPCWRT